MAPPVVPVPRAAAAALVLAAGALGCGARSALDVGRSTSASSTGGAPVPACDGGTCARFDCGKGAGTQPGAPWPMFGRCPSHVGRSPVAVEAKSLRWTFMFPSTTDYFQLSSPAVAADGTIYVGSLAGTLYAIAPDGTEKWEVATGAAISSSPAIGADGTVFVGSDDMSLYAVSPDGSVLWTFATGGAVDSPAIGADGTAYIMSEDDNLYAVAPADGSLKWAFTPPNGNAVDDNSPAIAGDGTLRASFGDGIMHTVGPDGMEKGAFDEVVNILSPPSIDGEGTVYFAGGDDVVAVGSGETLRWSFTTMATPGMPAIGEDGTIYATSSDGNLYAIGPDGMQRWAFSTSSQPQIPVIAGDGTLYFGSRDHHVYAVAQDGTGAAIFEVGGEIRSSPAIGADGTLYVSSADGALSAFGP